jgi:hypothetical protein
MKVFRAFFKKVIVCFYPHGQPDFRTFIRLNFEEARFVESGEFSEKWRETAVNFSLGHSTSDRVLFTEQDFFAKDDSFYQKVMEAATKFDTIGIRQGTRLHPCFLLTKRALIDQTSRDFAVHGEHKDHFSQFSQEILSLGSFADLKELSLFSGHDWFHLSSLTWNLFRIKDNNIREMHNTPDFLTYNSYSRTPLVPQDKRWLAFTYYADYLLSDFGNFWNFEGAANLGKKGE